MTCWKHDWQITEICKSPAYGPGYYPFSIGDMLGVGLGTTIVGSIACMLLAATLHNSYGEYALLALLLLIPMNILAQFINRKCDWANVDAACPKCKSVWLGLTKSYLKADEDRIYKETKIEQAKALVAKRKEMFRKSRC